jgi:hypothetical protein
MSDASSATLKPAVRARRSAVSTLALRCSYHFLLLKAHIMKYRSALKALDRRSSSSVFAESGLRLGIGSLCWLLLWAGLNTGPWNLDFDNMSQNWNGYFNGIRALFPLAVPVAWLFRCLLYNRYTLRLPTLAEGLWLYYGLICFISTIYVDPWFNYAYWGFAYLGTFTAAEMFLESGPGIDRARELNRLSWLAATLILVIVAFIGRGQLLAQSQMGLSGYGFIERMPTVGGMPMSRESGVSRYAAILALVSFVQLWNSRPSLRLFWMGAFALSSYLVWTMQSRGSTFSFCFALSFVMIVTGGWARRLGLGVAVAFVGIYLMGEIPSETVHGLYLYATRDTEGQKLEDASGRTSRIFPLCWKTIQASPIIGYGWLADRRVASTDAQNGFLDSLLCGGFLGGLGFIIGLFVAWIMLLRLLRIKYSLREHDRVVLIQVAGVMAFLTLRTIPENCAALFSVDLMIQLPALIYLGELDRSVRAAAVARKMMRFQPLGSLVTSRSARFVD